jgi:formate hydrogenlyase transcriptional activator
MNDIHQSGAGTAATERYQALLRVSQTLISIRSSEELFRLLARELRAVVSFYVMGVGFYDENTHEVRLTSYGEAGDPIQVSTLAPEETFTWWVYQHQQPLIIPCLDTETRFPAVAELLKNRGIRSICSVPLTTVHRRLGDLVLGSAEADAYSTDEVAFLSLVANQVVQAVDDALHFDASLHAKEILRGSEESFRQIVDRMPAFAWCASPDGKLEYLNRGIVDYTAKRQEDLVGFGWAKVLHPQDVERTKKAWLHSVETGEPCDVEQRVRRFDGVYRWFRTVAQPLRDHSGRVIRWYGVATDIEDWKRAEEALRGSEENFRLIVDSIPGLVHTLTAAGELEFVNQQNLDYFGKTLEELRNWASSDVFHPGDLPRAIDAWKHTLETGQPDEIECRLRRADGVYRWFQLRCLPLRNSEGRIVRWISLHTDIDDRKRAEEALRASEQSLRMIVDSIPGLVATMNAAGELQLFNRQLLEYFGRIPEELKNWATSDLVHPDDLPRAIAAFTRAVETGEPYDIEHRGRRADGVYRWLQVRALPVRDTEGHIISWYLLLTDIDERKRAEEALRASELNLRLVVDTIPGLVCTMSAAGEVETLNRQVLEYFGKTAEELKSWATSDAVHPDDLSRVLAAFTRSIETGQPYDIEHRCRRADGVYRWFQVRALPVRDTEGGITGWYILLTDIDERKQAEGRLQLLLDVTNQVVSNLQLRDLLRAISSSVRRVMQCDVVSVCFPDSEMQRLQTFVIDFPHSKGFIREDLIPIEGSLGGFVFRTGQPWAGNASDLLRLGIKNDPAMAEGLKTGCVLPLISRNGVLGVLTLGRREDNSFSQVDIGFLTQVASQVAIAVENASAYRQIEDARTELEKAFEEIKRLKDRLQDENVALREQIDQALMFEEIVGVSPALRAVLSLVSKVAPTDSTVLLTGETGTGKELIARAIHKRSQRSSRAFVSVNCAAIPASLIASELFGHERGAFTGATQRRIGRFELAEEGTLFLDEVGELPAETQIALLHVLQEREFQRVGGNQSIRSNARVIGATNRDLEAAITEGTFRNDLFYRLNVFPIEIPPLRERKEDIPLLVEYFIDRFARKAGKSIRGINKKTLDLLMSYPWPGNIRELQNVVERSVIVGETENFFVDESWLSRKPLADGPKSQLELSQKLAAQEKKMIEAALSESGGRVSGPSGAAAKLGLHRSTLESKILSLKINKYRFKTLNSSRAS